jgi:phenylalanine-4-hydroxylase
MRTKYLIDDFQQTYFVIESFEKLLDDCYRDFAPIYQRIGMASDIEADEDLNGDDVVTRGTLAYFKSKRA